MSGLYRRELEKAPDVAAARAEEIAEYRELFAHPYVAAQHGFIDEVIQPRQTRSRLLASLATLATKRDRTLRRSTATSRSAPVRRHASR